MSKVTFKSIQDLQNYGAGGTLLQEELEGKLRMMLRHQRETRGLSLHTVSVATGIQENTIELIEHGRKAVRWGMLARLLQYYGFWVKVTFISQPRGIKLDELELE